MSPSYLHSLQDDAAPLSEVASALVFHLVHISFLVLRCIFLLGAGIDISSRLFGQSVLIQISTCGGLGSMKDLAGDFAIRFSGHAEDYLKQAHAPIRRMPLRFNSTWSGEPVRSLAE
ncbi:hypothetical protein B0H13DRAFT_2267009 [Mycena leptocephala]|nr:hypothetical protein B0H13DRAFT_2267009 [Mycena leptocephala]